MPAAGLDTGVAERETAAHLEAPTLIERACPISGNDHS